MGDSKAVITFQPTQNVVGHQHYQDIGGDTGPNLGNLGDSLDYIMRPYLNNNNKQ